MAHLPESVAAFLACDRIAVAGVSRDGNQPANAIFRKLRDTGHDVVPLNPQATELEGVACYPDLAALPEPVGAVMVATHPDVALDVVQQCASQGVRHVWFHRSFGQGSVAADAVQACEDQGIACIVGGCPLMYCAPVDVAHRCMRWWLARQGRVPS